MAEVGESDEGEVPSGLYKKKRTLFDFKRSNREKLPACLPDSNCGFVRSDRTLDPTLPDTWRDNRRRSGRVVSPCCSVSVSVYCPDGFATGRC